MKNEEAKKPRKPLLSIEVEKDEKELFQKTAKARGLSVSALARTLMLDEARRLGIS
jgi:post-segregation antitoxin (ccd killing protein)